MSIQQTIERIHHFAASKGWKKYRLAREAKLNKTTLRNFDSVEWNPSRKIIERLESIIPSDFEPECCESYPAKPSPKAKAKFKAKPKRKRGDA